MNTIKTLILFCLMAGFAWGQVPPATPLLLDISAGAKRSFNLPSGKVLEFKPGSTLEIDDGTVFNIGSTAATALRAAIGDFSATRVFTNDANRLAATPTFVGQLALQTDGPLPILLMSNSTTTGDWGSSFAIAAIQSGSYLQAAGGVRGYALGAYSGVLGVSNVAGLSGGWMESTNTGTALNLNSTSTGLLLEGRNSGSVNVSLSKTGVFLAGNGAVGGPSLAFINDPDTGLYSSGANTIGIAVGGASIGTLSSSGLALTSALSGSALALTAAGTAGAPAVTMGGDTDSGVYSAGANSVGIAAAGANVGTFSASGLALTTALSVANGGTGSTTATAARTALAFDRAIFWDQRAARTDGDAVTAGSWTKLTINTEHADTANGFSVASSVITVGAAGAGDWWVTIRVPFFKTGSAAARLRRTNNTAATLSVGGLIYSWSGTAVGDTSESTRLVTLASGDTLELQAYTQDSGWAGTSSVGPNDEVSIYSQIIFERK